MKERLDSYCGMYCGACSTEGCDGCKSLSGETWSPDCKMKACAIDKGIESCCFCSDYPCHHIMAFDSDGYRHHRTALPNGRRLKEVGLAVWLEEQKQRWSCKQCGEAYTWFEDTCRSCGSALFSVQAEFADKSN